MAVLWGSVFRDGLFSNEAIGLFVAGFVTMVRAVHFVMCGPKLYIGVMWKCFFYDLSLLRRVQKVFHYGAMVQYVVLQGLYVVPMYLRNENWVFSNYVRVVQYPTTVIPMVGNSTFSHGSVRVIGR